MLYSFFVRRDGVSGDRLKFRGNLCGWGLLLAATVSLGSSTPKAPLRPEEDKVHSLPSGISITAPPGWAPMKSELASPPELLASSSPPVHFTEILVLENSKEDSVLLLATSNNLLLGHDAYWLDEQMHSSSDSSMSLPNFLFYLFFPPPYACLTGAENGYTGTGRTPVHGDEQPDLEVYLRCELSPVLPHFYAAQISAGVVLRKEEEHLRAFGVLKDFYLAPMDIVESSGMTFYVFEAKGTERISSDEAKYFQLPGALEGSQADFFWAIGAQTPFPFVRDRARANAPIIHMAYAGLGASERPEFMGLLRKIRIP